MPSPDARIDALFENLPNDPRDRLDAIAQLYAAIRERAARHLEPAVRAILEEAQDEPYAGKVQLSRQINHVLHDARLAIVDPVTDLPSALVANRPGTDSHIGRFYLRDTRNASDGKRHSVHLKGPDMDSISLVAMRSEEDSNARHR